MCSRPRKPQRKPKPSASDGLGLKLKLASFRLELLQRLAQRLEVLVGRRIDAAIDHVQRLAVAGERLDLGAALRDRVADLDLFQRLHVRDEVADLAGAQLVARLHVRAEAAELEHLVLGLRHDHPDLSRFLIAPSKMRRCAIDAAVVVELGVEEERAQRLLRSPFGGGISGSRPPAPRRCRRPASR
jgi:hypothetical protein